MSAWENKFINVNKYARSGKKLTTVRKIIMHYTANPGASAMNHYKYFNNLKDRYASAHFFVDRVDSLCIVPLNEVAYHANDVQKRVNGVAYRGVAALKPNANLLSLGIEMCIEKDGTIHPDTVKRATAIAVELCKKYGLDPLTDIVRHYDVTAKNCPAPWVADKSQFEAFKIFVKNELAGNGPTIIPAPSKKVDSVIIEQPAKQEVYRKGDSGQAVKGLQQNLIKLGYTLPEYGDDGSYGNETVEAVKAFQRANGLLDDGIAGSKTIAKITELLKAQSTPKQEELPKVTSLGDKYSFQVKSKVAAGVYKYSNLAEKQKTIGANTIFSVYGYTEGVKAWAVPGGFVMANQVEPIAVTLKTGGLTKGNEAEFRSFLKGEGIDSELNVHAVGNPSAEITVAGLQLVKVKQFLDVKGWYYK